jgi:maltose alpha-D-glucosyltransferase/alpha-amylase
LTENHSRARDDGRHYLLYGYRWYRVGGLDYLLKRSDIDEPHRRPNAKARIAPR